MIEHYLDETQVFPASGEKIQITAENAILTKSGSYTLEVKFPLSIFENRRFFGNLDRIDITKNVKTWQVKVVNNGQILMDGTATLVKTTKEEISLQYVAGNSQVNFWDNADKTYIDEYDYNTMEDGRDRVDVWFQDYASKVVMGGYGGPEKKGRQFLVTSDKEGKTKKVIDNIWFFYKDNPARYEKPEKIFFGVEKEFCFANVYDEDYDWVQDDPYKIKSGITLGNGATFGQVVFGMADVSYGMTLNANCIMPHLMFVIEQVIKKRGYSIGRNDAWFYGNTDDLYIASPRLSLTIADALPHWTVKEFFEQIGNFFNCTLVFDEEKRICNFVANNTIVKNNIIKNDIIKIEEINKEHKEDNTIEEKSEANIFSSNIKYKDIGKEDVIRCDESTRKKYETVYGESLENLRDKALHTSQAEWKFYKDKSRNGCTYGWNGRDMVAIDHLCPLYRGSENDLELKIVPARIGIYYYPTGEHDNTTYVLVPMAVLTMNNSWKGYIHYGGNLIEEVQGLVKGEGKGTKEDFLPVFFYGGHRRSSDDGRGHYAVTWESYSEDAKEAQGIHSRRIGHCVMVGDQYTGAQWKQLFETNERKNQSLALVPGHTKYYQGEIFIGNPKINMESELRISFKSIVPPNPRAVFLIHNKKYLSSKIEYEIDDNGIIPLMKGYFHEVIKE